MEFEFDSSTAHEKVDKSSRTLAADLSVSVVPIIPLFGVGGKFTCWPGCRANVLTVFRLRSY